MPSSIQPSSAATGGMLPLLLEVLRQNRDQRESILPILRLDSMQRKIAINVLVTDLRRKQAPVDFVQALDSLQDDSLAEAFRRMIEDQTIEARTTKITLLILFCFALAVIALLAFLVGIR